MTSFCEQRLIKTTFTAKNSFLGACLEKALKKEEGRSEGCISFLDGLCHYNLPTFKSYGIDDLLVKMQGVDVVVNLAWEESFANNHINNTVEKKSKSFKSNNLFFLESLIKAAELSNVRRIVFPSFLGVSSQTSKKYLREKYLAERLVLNSKIKEKIILRLPFVLERLYRESVFREAIEKTYRFPFFLSQNLLCKKVCMINTEDFIKIIINSIKNPLQQGVLIVPVLGERLFSSKECLDYVIQKKKTKKASKIDAFKFANEFALMLSCFVGKNKNRQLLFDLMEQAKVDYSEIKSMEKSCFKKILPPKYLTFRTEDNLFF